MLLSDKRSAWRCTSWASSAYSFGETIRIVWVYPILYQWIMMTIFEQGPNVWYIVGLNDSVLSIRVSIHVCYFVLGSQFVACGSPTSSLKAKHGLHSLSHVTARYVFMFAKRAVDHGCCNADFHTFSNDVDIHSQHTAHAPSLNESKGATQTSREVHEKRLESIHHLITCI